MSRRHPGGHTIPDNPHWIEFPRSDGSPSHLPKNTTKVIDSEGQVNYMRPVEMEESLSILWRVSVGAAMATRMNMPKGPSYVLKDFPKGYQLYDHNKGPAKAPRHDPYLYGSTNVNRFRSTNEFIPHAIWLMTDETLNRANCQCKYCTKQPQRIISDTMGLSARRSASAASGLPPSASRPPRVRREPRERRQDRVATKPFAAVRRAPKPLPVGPQQYITPERDLDVRTSFALEEGHRPRRYRKGELLWYHLDPPIRGRNPEEDITFWPGIVDESHIKTNAVPTASPDGDVDMAPVYAEKDADGVPLGPNEIPLEAPGSVPWRIEQWYIYKVKLLGAACSVFVAEEQVLPYLAYAPTDQVIKHVQDELANFLQTVPIDQMDRDIESHIFAYDPMEAEPPGDAYYTKYQRAVAPYTLAIQIASNVAHYWLPTDEWDCKFQVPPPSPVASASSDPPVQPLPQSQPQNATLHSVIEQSLTKNATSSASISGPNGVVTEPESISMLGRVSRSMVPQTVVQTRFQGLWWGTERIWTGELVRLKIARAQFAPKGTDIIFPPAGPSARTLEWYKQKFPDMLEGGEDSVGAGQRGLFLRLEGLVVVDVPTDGSFTKECRASGMLYEVVDEDWEEPRASQAVPADAKGKGRARESPDETMPDSISQGPSGSSFMPQPSPPKTPLPNPDPTVPVSETAASQPSPAATPTSGAADTASEKKSDLHSHPVLFTPYPLPPASASYKFRPILPDGYEVVISLSLISGRYYPGLLRHPLLESTIKDALANQDELSHRHLWALDGLSPGVHQSMDPRYWKGSRLLMFQDADKDARDRFKELWEETKMARLHPESGEAAMEVD
ncbi:hypothetical protein L226DRAFT_611784 [Lentinus tigrinus ALCF2SS1-7]|uniref:Cryptic loci regulator 2 N-terminal domain-containing protein n=1 Tax=Lentinus tigrinus ALCF2SS1-6 TaxID=1328759 RepID=A0A5C2SM36_9APHY|nr:hypothetical protein L227DRAFT_650399 [Lentinus tigrinus ALCF2SS1-6]RPD76398.1 hypothetical protein L226DRAFT_611784 [Lentinus tigrinus ALCF2SS1-7]